VFDLLNKLNSPLPETGLGRCGKEEQSMHTITKLALVALAAAFAGSIAAASGPGFTDTTILIGQSAALSGASKALGEETRLGIELCFDAVNAQGGVHGRRIKLISEDDAYDPVRARDNTLKLIAKQNVFALLGYVGTDTSLAAMPVFSYYEVPFVGAATGSGLLRVPYNRQVFNVRASFTDEAARIVRQLTTTGIRGIAVFYQNDAYGLDGLEAVRDALGEHGLQLAGKGSVGANNDVRPAVYLINGSAPDAVIMFAAYQQSAAFVREMRKQGSTAQFYSTSLVGSQALLRELGEQSHGVVISQVMPYPWSATSLIVRDYQKLMMAAGHTPSYGSMEGYVAARVMVEALRRVGKNLTREALIAALENMNNVDLDGFNLNFSPGNHNGTAYVDLTIVGRTGRFLH
jgi:branched-chain amino acid transport system substrate-binding protein